MIEAIIKVSARGITKYHEFEKKIDAQQFYDSYKDVDVEIHLFEVKSIKSRPLEN